MILDEHVAPAPKNEAATEPKSEPDAETPVSSTVESRDQHTGGHPSAIRTWPLTADEVNQLEQSLGRRPATSSGHAEDMDQAPATVQQWPAWLQKQWVATQRRRAWQMAHPPTLMRRLSSPGGMLITSAFLLIALISFGLGAALNAPASASASSSSSSNTSSMSGSMSSSGSQLPANVPDATQQYGNQPARFVIDADGAKHFTLTAEQVLWQPVKGQKVLAWTLDGTVPGPMIHATAGDHIRITIINHLPEATAIHWHGLEVPTDNDGVPPIGMKPIQPGQ